MKRIDLVIFCGLCLVMAILFVRYSKKKDEFKAAREVIEKDSVINQYFKDSRKIHTDFYRSAKSYFRGNRNSAHLIEQYSNVFSHSIGKLLRFIPNQEEIDDEGFFQKKIMVDSQTQTELWQAQRNFIQIIEAYLDTTSKTEIQFHLKAKAKAEQELKKIRNTIDNAVIGRELSFWYSFMLVDTTLALPVTVQKQIDGIYGDDRYNLIPSYLKLLEYNIESPKKQKVRAILQEMKDAFSREGFVMVHKSEYNLSSVTIAELRSLYKYLSFMESDLNMHFIDEITGRIP